jgi:hypothetical protein
MNSTTLDDIALVQVHVNRQVFTYYRSGVFFIVDKKRLAGYLRAADGHLIESVTGANYINYGMNYLKAL